MESGRPAADGRRIWRISAASPRPEVPIVVVNELHGIELLACYSDGGANPLAWAKVVERLVQRHA
jgi:hypothetical protein